MSGSGPWPASPSIDPPGRAGAPRPVERAVAVLVGQVADDAVRFPQREVAVLDDGHHGVRVERQEGRGIGGWKPEPQSSRSKGRSSSTQVHRTLRTLMDEAFPRIFSMRRTGNGRSTGPVYGMARPGGRYSLRFPGPQQCRRRRQPPPARPAGRGMASPRPCSDQPATASGWLRSLGTGEAQITANAARSPAQRPTGRRRCRPARPGPRRSAHRRAGRRRWRSG